MEALGELCDARRRCNVSPKPSSRKESRLTTFRHGGPCGLRIEMRSAERGINPAFLVELRTACLIGTGLEGGGCSKTFRSGLPQPHSSIYLIPLWLAILKRPSRVPGAACRAGTRATPPKKWGVMRSRKAMRLCSALFARMTGRYRPHLSLREGLEQPPFPSRFIVSDRFSPSRVRFAASRPGRLRADPKDALLTRGKGGGRAVGRKGGLPSA